MKLPRPLPLAFALATLFGGSAQAQNLVQMYEAARGYDASYQSALAQYTASVAKADQATSGILPSVGIGAGYSGTQFENKTGNATFDNSFRTENANISASQPLYRPANLATYEQGRKQVEVAKAQLASVEQDLILRVSQAYFDVLAAQDNLVLVREQKKAVAEQFASAKRNFEVGTATITDSREAEAQYDLILAEEINVENDVRVKRLALELIVGRPANELKPLARPVVLPPVTPSEPEPWVQIAYENNPTVQQSRLALDIAKLGVAKAYAGHKPTLDLTASYGNTRYPGGNSSTGFYTRTTAGTVGLSFNLPVFSGFLVQNQVKEALSLEEKAKSDVDAAERSVAQFTRAAVYSLKSGLGRVKALETAEASTQSALDANVLGYQVGVRINLDVLNSQTKVFATKRDLDQTRYNVLVGGLRLRQAAGTLKLEDLNAVNTLLAK
ncbi:TolC family outer membrane protein [Candidatus Skiveiella danica]|jgi:outer membrane protein|uniref:TolC family outer membrane protein n=1 Tax=Candidatus Skiveiella danica TaxID=3386177 RepID=UPI0009D18B8F|nr:MAG: Outer membrane protein TolC precursor [Alphaproteobacteria bacterium ADurb.Bin100]